MIEEEEEEEEEEDTFVLASSSLYYSIFYLLVWKGTGTQGYSCRKGKGEGSEYLHFFKEIGKEIINCNGAFSENF